MANEVPEEQVQGARPATGGRLMAVIMILLVIVCLLMGANLLVTLKKGGQQSAGQVASEEVEAEPTIGAFPWDMAEARQLRTRDGVVELQFQVEFATEEALVLFGDSQSQVEFNDALIGIFRTKSNDELGDIEQLKADIKAAIEKIVGENQVNRISFGTFLDQKLR